jgi:hypothetical protein
VQTGSHIVRDRYEVGKSSSKVAKSDTKSEEEFGRRRECFIKSITYYPSSRLDKESTAYSRQREEEAATRSCGKRGKNRSNATERLNEQRRNKTDTSINSEATTTTLPRAH